MLKISLPVGLLLFFFSTQILADCNTPNDRLTTTAAIEDEFRGKKYSASGASGDWKEETCANGDLFKTGDGSTIDPRKKVGTWRAIGGNTDARIEYQYGSSAPYRFLVFKDTTDNIIYFCNNGNDQIAKTISIATGSC